MEKKQTSQLLATFCLFFFAILAVWFIYGNTHTSTFSGLPMQQGHKYILYIGTNNPITHTQLVPTEEVNAKVDAICEKYVEGFTVFRANGNWLDTTGTKVREDTLVYCFYNATDAQMKAIMDDTLKVFHQSAILLEKTDTDVVFYSGDVAQ